VTIAKATSRIGLPGGSSQTHAKRGVVVHRAGVPSLLFAAWGALFLNVLAFSGSSTLIPLPRSIGQMMTQGSLGLALLLALCVNRRGVMRPNLFLVLLSMLALVAFMVSIHNEYMLGSTFRASRLVGFVLVLWLLTPWFGRRDMLLLRLHRRCLWVVLGSVFLGAVISPGMAFSFEGRLSGILWPIPPTQVAHYAAMLLGTSALLWMCRVITGPHALVAFAFSGALLIGTHTRTALLAAVVGLVVASASLFLGHARVRRTSASGLVFGVVLATFFAPELTTWARRGQTAQEASQLTGRTKVWSDVFAMQRPRTNEWFGSGLSNMSFNGLPIDSNWVATYLDQGWFGLVIEASFLLLLLGMAATHVRGPQRAVALFIIVYCLVASITETGLGNASPYLLDLTVAAALLVPEPQGNRR
jgi:hypothetical protein